MLAAILCAILAFDAVALADPPAPPAEEARAEPKAEALARFERGNALFKSDALKAALAEFLASRELYPTKSATNNAALCLTRLRRYDEALDLYESLLKEFPDVPEDLKAQAQREVVRLRDLTGTIEIAGAPVAAVITIDGRSRGEFPSPGPLRVVAGSHLVRLTKDGFEPFETRVEVAGGETARVPLRLRALAASGRLHVVEQSGQALSLVVDGDVVGNTPFDGLLGVGDHVVLLRGEGEIGSPPVAVHLEQNQITRLTLAAQALRAALRIEPAPANANMAIDAVTVGRGVWEGRLPAGEHKVEVTAPGFLPEMRKVKLERGERSIIAVALKRDPSSPLWSKPSRAPGFLLEFDAAGLLAPTFSDVHGSLVGHTAVGAGEILVLHGGYELGSGFDFGVTAGALVATQTAYQISIGAGLYGDVTNLLSGFSAGAWAGFTFGSAFRVHFRLGVGGMFGTISDTETDNYCWSCPVEGNKRTEVTRGATFTYVTPEVRLGLPLSRRLELNAGLAAPIFIDTSLSHKYLVPTLVMVAPGLGARYNF